MVGTTVSAGRDACVVVHMCYHKQAAKQDRTISSARLGFWRQQKKKRIFVALVGDYPNPLPQQEKAPLGS